MNRLKASGKESEKAPNEFLDVVGDSGSVCGSGAKRAVMSVLLLTKWGQYVNNVVSK